MEITNLTGFEKPASVLIEKISDAIGGLALPWQMRRVAKADAEVTLIKAEKQFKLTEVQQRGMERLVFDAATQQQNIEAIAYKAIELLSDTAKPEQLEQDWLRAFFDKSKNVSDTEMQDLWAKLLAQETNANKSVSKRTINLVEDFDKSDAFLFEVLCKTLVCLPTEILFKDGFYSVNKCEPAPIIMSNGENSFFNEMGLTYSKLCHLESIGLIVFTKFGYISKPVNEEPSAWIYHDKGIYFEPHVNDKNLYFGAITLTKAGEELAKIAAKKQQSGFFEEIFSNIKKTFPLQEILSTQEALKKLFDFYQSKK
jgi:hypothetical protein